MQWRRNMTYVDHPPVALQFTRNSDTGNCTENALQFDLNVVLRFKASGIFRGISIQRERMALHDFQCTIRFVIWSSTMPTGLLAGVHNVQFPHKGSIGDNRKVLLSISLQCLMRFVSTPCSHEGKHA